MEIQIVQHEDYPIREPKFHFGQAVEDVAEDDHGYISGMQYDEHDGWQYKLIYLDLAVYGRWINESGLNTILEISGLGNINL